jgi:solute carrier family 25 oxoglutarate transporter 11
LAPEGFATQVLASSGAGLLAAVASNPIDVVKTRVMNMKVVEATAAGHGGETAAAGGTLAPPPYKGALDCAIKTVRAEGPMALYKGFVPTVTRQAPFAIVMFLSLEQIRKVFEHL